MTVRENSTGLRLKEIIDEGENWGWLDPIYGLPEDACPVVLDRETKLLRPFSSMETVYDPETPDPVVNAVADFYGWAVGYQQPRAATQINRVLVVRRGIVELDLPTPTACKIGDTLKPLTETVNAVTFVSNFDVEVVATAAECLYKIVKICSCSSYAALQCPPTAAAPADDPTDTAATYPTVRKVWAEFNVMHRSKA